MHDPLEPMFDTGSFYRLVAMLNRYGRSRVVPASREQIGFVLTLIPVEM